MKSPVLFTILLLFIGVTFTSCYKKEETVAIVTVIDENNQPVSGAEVRMFGTSTQTPSQEVILNETRTTNSNGEAVFNMDEIYQTGQAGVALVNIEVTGNGFTTEGIMKIVQEETSRETIILQ